MSARWLVTGMVVGALAASCTAPQTRAVLSTSAEPVSVDAAPVPLNPKNVTQTTVGEFQFAGGIDLTSRHTDALHGLSDLEVTDSNRLIAVGDDGIFLEARLVLDRNERLVGVSDARISRLMGIDGSALSTRDDTDAEGLALMPGGDRLVSFERRNRIWLYPASGGPPLPVPSPQFALPRNGGMEALAPDPEAGPDAYVVGAEEAGDTWTCRLSFPTCDKGPTIEKPKEFGLVAIQRLPGRQTAILLRAYDAERGVRVVLKIVGAGATVTSMELAAPLTVDNFEGLAAVPRADGVIRFYLISDDNSPALQRTLLLAFDWKRH